MKRCRTQKFLTSMKQFFFSLGSFLFFCLCIFGIYSVQTYAEKSGLLDQAYTSGVNEKNIPKAEEIQPLLLGFDVFAADLYWLKTVQYVGENASSGNLNLLPKYLELVTDLDPHFVGAYKLGGTFYPLDQKTFYQTEEWYQKSLEHNPKNIDLILNFAFFTYYYQGKYEKAAEMYETCTKQFATCPKYAKSLAASLRARTGKYEMALQMWIEQLQKEEYASPDQQKLMKKKIEESVKLMALTCATENFEITYGRSPNDLSELLFKPIDPCLGFSNLPPKISIELSAQYDLAEVTEQTLRSPFEQNAFKWDATRKKVKTKLW